MSVCFSFISSFQDLKNKKSQAKLYADTLKSTLWTSVDKASENSSFIHSINIYVFIIFKYLLSTMCFALF